MLAHEWGKVEGGREIGEGNGDGDGNRGDCRVWAVWRVGGSGGRGGEESGGVGRDVGGAAIMICLTRAERY